VPVAPQQSQRLRGIGADETVGLGVRPLSPAVYLDPVYLRLRPVAPREDCDCRIDLALRSTGLPGGAKREGQVPSQDRGAARIPVARGETDAGLQRLPGSARIAEDVLRPVERLTCRHLRRDVVLGRRGSESAFGERECGPRASLNERMSFSRPREGSGSL